MNHDLIYLFKFQRLLHERIDLTVGLFKKNLATQKIKRVQKYKTTMSILLKGACTKLMFEPTNS